MKIQACFIIAASCFVLSACSVAQVDNFTYNISHLGSNDAAPDQGAPQPANNK